MLAELDEIERAILNRRVRIAAARKDAAWDAAWRERLRQEALRREAQMPNYDDDQWEGMIR